MSADSQETTRDAFHRGKFWLVQPARGAHRAGLDAMLLAAAVPTDFSGTVADFGAGAGAAGLAVISRCPQAHALLIERSPEMAGFARAGLSLDENGELSRRATVIEADLAAPAAERSAAGLTDNCADFIIMNPPFNDEKDRATTGALKRQAHVMESELWERWLRTAASLAKPKAGLALIARPASLPEILPALKGRFGAAQMISVHPRDDRAAIRIIIRAWYGARGKLSIVPPLVIHGPSGNRFTARTDDLCNGAASLFGD